MKSYSGCYKSMANQILKSIFKSTFLLIFSIALFSLTFIGSLSVKALEESPLTEVNGENTLEVIIDPVSNTQLESDEKLETTNTEKGMNSYPDLGDDQIFPFVAGLDSYE